MRWEFVLIILGMGVATYATRRGFIGAARQFQLHPLLRRALEYVPVSILAALVFPAVLAPSGHLESPLTNVYLWAAAATVALVLATRRQWLAIVLGVACLVVFRRLLGA